MISTTDHGRDGVVETWFGVDFARLHPQLQALHRRGGRLSGPVDVRLGSGIAGWIGRRLARRIGVPLPDPRNTLEVVIFDDAQSLHWHRRFNAGREFRSRFVAHGNFPDGYWVEATGSIELVLGVRILDGAWHWQQRGGRCKGIPLPRWLMPQTVAYKEVRDGLYRFSVDMRLPLLGSLLSYRGGLMLQARDTANAAESEAG
jgi:hypothetical protein